MQGDGLGGTNKIKIYMDFSRDFYWHDAVMKSIIIDRNNPTVVDEIGIDIEWPVGYKNEDDENNENEEEVIQRIVFESVLWAKLDLDFSYLGSDTIRNAEMLDNNDEDLVNLYSTWKGFRDHIKLNVYVINLNTSGGKIKIIAKGFRIE